MNNDFIGKLRKEQAEFVVCQAKEIMQQMPQEIKGSMGSDDLAFWTSEVEDNAMRSTHAYTNWLASRIVRSKNFDRQAIPVCDEKTLDILSQKYSVPVAFIEAFIPRLCKRGRELPLLGRITDDDTQGELIPNKAAIEQWAAFYSWD